jgi:hypothetical protein
VPMGDRGREREGEGKRGCQGVGGKERAPGRGKEGVHQGEDAHRRGCARERVHECGRGRARAKGGEGREGVRERVCKGRVCKGRGE